MITYGTIISEANNEQLIHYQEENSYSGEWILLTYSWKYKGFRIYKDWFGSCSICDYFQRYFDYDQIYNGAEITQEKKEAFAKAFKVFCFIPEILMNAIINEKPDLLLYLLPTHTKIQIDLKEIIDKIKML